MFKQCEKGHDLTAKSAYLYRNTGQRECRQCALDAKAVKPRKVRGIM